jgi:hypothetical protein
MSSVYEQTEPTTETNTQPAPLNSHLDIGNLTYEDCQSYAEISMEEFAKRTANNLCAVYRALFDLKKKQDAKHGEDGEILEYTKSAYNV